MSEVLRRADSDYKNSIINGKVYRTSRSSSEIAMKIKEASLKVKIRNRAVYKALENK